MKKIIDNKKAAQFFREMANLLESHPERGELSPFIIETKYLTHLLGKNTALTYLSTSFLIRTDKIDDAAPALCKEIIELVKAV